MATYKGWALACIVMGSTALAAPPRAQPVTTTQRAVISPQAFAADDPVMKSPQAAKALTATMVSANFTNTPAMQAFADLAKQTGYRIELYDRGGQTNFGRVTVSITNQPFWAAMREICTRGNVNLYWWSDEERDRIAIMPSNYGGNQGMFKAAASIKGPYMTLVSNIQRVNTVNMANPQQVDRQVQVQIFTFAEPKAVPVQYAWEPAIDEAVDDNGNSMTPPTQDRNNRNMQGSRGITWQGSFTLPYPQNNPGKRIAKLKGHMAAIVQLGSEPIDIADPLKAAEVTKTIGGQRLTFKSLKKRENGGQYELELIFYRDGRDQQAFNNLWQFNPMLKLTDAQGGRYQFGGGGGNGGGEKITRQFIFYRRGQGGGRSDANAPEPSKLVIEVPTATQEIAIPFELVDLPLP